MLYSDTVQIYFNISLFLILTEQIRLRIFDPFYTTVKVGKGTGQELAISHDVIVEKHLGSIAVESTPGVGIKFIISLPMEVEAIL